MEPRDWDDRYREKPLLWSAGPNRFVAEELADLEPGSALDVACGEGRNAVWLAGLGWEVTGVDFSGVALDRGRRMAEQAGVDVEFVEADVLDWDPRGSYDLVLIAYVHFPADQRRSLIGKAASWVGPRGTIMLVGHDLSTAGVSGPSDPDVLWTPERVVELLEGWEILVAERRPRETDTGEIAADTVVLARRLG